MFIQTDACKTHQTPFHKTVGIFCKHILLSHVTSGPPDTQKSFHNKNMNRRISPPLESSSIINQRNKCPWSLHCQKDAEKSSSSTRCWQVLLSFLLFCRRNMMLLQEEPESPSVCCLFHSYTHNFTHLCHLAPKACHWHIFKKSLVPHLSKHILGP